MSARHELTPKQAAFVAEYLVDQDATQAAIRAGYNIRWAAVIGQENLANPRIRQAIEAAGISLQDATGRADFDFSIQSKG